MASLYTSEITQLLEDMKKKRPELEEEQRRGRAIWWDKAGLDLEELRRQKESHVPQSPYVYQTKS